MARACGDERVAVIAEEVRDPWDGVEVGDLCF